MRSFTYERRTQFVEKMNAEVEAIRQNVEALSAKVAKMSAAEKAKIAPQLKALREKMELMEKQLVALEGATPTTWEGIKADSLKAYEAVSEGFDQARQWASDKIAP